MTGKREPLKRVAEDSVHWLEYDTYDETVGKLPGIASEAVAGGGGAAAAPALRPARSHWLDHPATGRCVIGLGGAAVIIGLIALTRCLFICGC